MSQVCFSVFFSFSCKDVFVLLFLSVSSCPSAKPLLSPPFHPHSLLSDCRSVQVGCTRFSRCCYLVIDLVPPFEGNWSRTCRSHLISAVELGCSDAISLLSCRFFFFFSCMLFFFLPVFPNFPQRNFEPGSPRKDDRQLRRPLAPPVLWGALHSRPRRASLCGYCAGVRTPLHSPTTDAVVPPTFWPPQQPLVSWRFSLLARQVAVPIAADHYLPQRVPGCSAPPAPASSSNSGLLLC
jgi:hypothetical protein